MSETNPATAVTDEKIRELLAEYEHPDDGDMVMRKQRFAPNNTQYLVCEICRAHDVSRIMRDGTRRTVDKYVGTSIRKKCPDCCEPDGDGSARMCRGCCPSGHGARPAAGEAARAEESQRAAGDLSPEHTASTGR